MAHDTSQPHRVQLKQTLETKREREFYRYYEPIQSLTETGPPLCDLHNADSVKAHRPLSSPDRALTAFCQLGALRLGCRRAMLFFFDRNYAYVLAEATRTLSLQDDSVHEAEDSLWLGHTVIPRGYTICEETVCRLPSGDPTDDPISHIINDLDEDTQFCGKPYVTDGPKAKFYAGVPITTDKGVNIGAYCCLDDRRRLDGLDARGVAFLQDMAKTVMTHLEMVRAKRDEERSSRMVKSLGAFVEGAASMQSWEKETGRRDYRRVGGRSGSPAKRPPLEPVHSPTTANGIHRMTMQPSATTSSNSTATQKSSSEEVPGTPTDGATPDMSKVYRQSMRNVQDLAEQLIPPNVQDVFQRAADLLCGALRVDGVAFLDGSPNTFGGLVDSQEPSGPSSDAVSSATDQTGGESEGWPSSRIEKGVDKACKVLASSHSPEDKFNSKGELQHDIQATSIRERFLRSLLKRHPHGKIWNFSEDPPDTSSDESSPETGTRLDGHDIGKVSNTKDVNDTLARRAMRRKGRVDDEKEIRRLFPGVRSLALCGYVTKENTTEVERVLANGTAVNYMAAFCDVVMAEIYRLEAQNSDRMKADFISSISHELRSPLHGILGSVECLQELSFADSFHSDLVSQIEVCGRTLLDIVEHLLDYKKITTTKPSIPKEEAKPSPLKRPTLNDTRKTSMGAMMSLESQVSLDEVTEEVVSSAVYSFCCARSKENILNRRVTVLLDIDRAESVNWQCKVALGAWKRICINLVSNALKYTSEGFIHVSLKTVPIPGKRKRFNAVFTVQDSGRGMSKDFLANNFFRPFSQEDTLMEGTGLGMSLVAKIVRAMAGQVDVQSEKGRGTTMTVVVPIEVGRPSKAKRSLSAVAESLDGRRVGILGFGDARTAADAETADGSRHELARTKLLQSIRLSCEQLGLDVRQNTEDAELYIIAEADLSTYAQSKQLTSTEGTRSGLDKPLVVVCNSAISVRQLRTSSAAAGFTTERLEYTAQPLGTISLGKAIRNCLSTDSNVRDFSTSHQDATVGAASPRTVETIRPYQNDGIDERSGRLPIRVRTSHSSSASDQHQPPLPPITDMPSPHPLQRVANSTVAAQPDATSDGYLSTRSKSTGDRPLTPRAVEQVSSGKDPVTSNVRSVIAPSGLSLLLVDDNVSQLNDFSGRTVSKRLLISVQQINLQLLVNYARKQGHRKATASDGQQAVNAYKAACLASGHVQATASDSKTTDAAAGKDGTDTSNTLSEKPQVILMDISMPVLNGFEATRLIRAFELQNGLVPAHIIALTGLGSADAQQEAFSSGVDLFLTKPVRLKELTKLLDGIKNGDHTRGDTPVPK
ncbi:hypothetical protein LTR17_014017 [Elasticomyces elasticus]|nr:hypothetical protein LTR17_014017 [Elasticomyces elasticus]